LLWASGIVGALQDRPDLGTLAQDVVERLVAYHLGLRLGDKRGHELLSLLVGTGIRVSTFASSTNAAVSARALR
jgi:site-specific recombinase XerD